MSSVSPISAADAASSTLARHRLVLAALWLTAAAAEWGALQPAISGASPTFAANIVLHVVGASFAACGLLALHRRPNDALGRLMVVTGFLFFARPLLARVNWPVSQTIGFALGNWWVIVFVALLLSFPGRHRRWLPVERALIGTFVIAEALLVLVFMLFTPFPGNLLAAWPDAAVSGDMNKAIAVVSCAAAIAVAFFLGARWLVATEPVRRVSAPAAAGTVTLLFLSGLLLEGAFGQYQSPYLVWPTLVGLLLVPVVFLVGVWRSWAARAAVGDLLVELRSTRGEPLQAALAKTLGDPGLVLAYWLPEFGSYVDSHGEPVELPAEQEGRSFSIVEQDGERVAALIYDASLADERRLLEAVVAAAGIALQRERLAAELRAKLIELRTSRARIVGAGDRERRRLERDLHDGAQQRLVALSMQLQLLGKRISEDPAAAEALATAATAELAASLEELRELAHGIHPSVLDHGLPVALESLSSRSTVPTVVSIDLADRLPEPVEVAVYFVVSEALANAAKHAHARSVTVNVSQDSAGALVVVSDDGVGGADDAAGSGLRGLADRVEALGGQLRIRSPMGAGTTISAVIPCAS